MVDDNIEYDFSGAPEHLSIHPNRNRVNKTFNDHFDKISSVEFPTVTGFAEEGISAFDTNACNRDFDRKSVAHCGEVPEKNQRVVMFKKKGHSDRPVSVGTSAWLNG